MLASNFLTLPYSKLRYGKVILRWTHRRKPIYRVMSPTTRNKR